jgi:hypothetical protein
MGLRLRKQSRQIRFELNWAWEGQNDGNV